MSALSDIVDRLTAETEAAFAEVERRLVALEAGTPPPPPPPPPPPSGTYRKGIATNAGFPASTAEGNAVLAMKPDFLRGDSIAAAYAWCNANGKKMIGCATGKNQADTLALVAQYPNIEIWELDNEPYFGAKMNLVTYAQGKGAIAKAIKAQYPTKKVIYPCNLADGGDYPIPPGMTSWAPWLTQSLNASPDLKANIDGYAIHPYPNPRSAAPNFTVVDKVHGQAVAAGKDVPFYITEVGWSVGTGTGSNAEQVTEAVQATRIDELFALVAARPWIASTAVYCHRTWGTAFEESFGLLRADLNRRPAAGRFEVA